MTATAPDSDYVISEISAASPGMKTTDFAALCEDIKANGQLVPIWVRGAEVIDGRKRLAACLHIGIPPIVVNLSLEQDAEALSRSLNLIRTHYTPSQRAMMSSKRATATKASNKNQGKFAPVDVTLKLAASEAGVCRRAVVIAKRIRRVAAPEVVEAVEAGKLTLHAASRIAEMVPLGEQPDAVVRVLEASKGKARNTPVVALVNDRWANLAELAAEGHSSSQIAAIIGVRPVTVREKAAAAGISIQADVVIGRTAHLNHERIIRSFVSTLESLIPSCDMINASKVSKGVLTECLSSLDESLRAINKMKKRLRAAL